MQSGPSCINDFQLVRPEEVENMFQSFLAIVPNLDLCPFISCQARLIDWVQEVIQTAEDLSLLNR